MKLELISVVANPKGGNRTLRVRIRGRCNFSFDCVVILLYLYYIFYHTRALATL